MSTHPNPAPPEYRWGLRSTVLVVVVAVATAALAVLAAILAPSGAHAVAAWYAGIAAAVITAATALWATMNTGKQRLLSRLSARDTEAHRLTNEVLPALETQLREGVQPRAALTRIPEIKDDALRFVLHRVADSLAGATQELREYRERMARQQNETNQLNTALRELEARRTNDRAALAFVEQHQLPAVLSGEAAPDFPEDLAVDQEFRNQLGSLLDAVSRNEEKHRSRTDTVRMAVVALGRTVQASAHRIQEEATRMIERHPANPDVLESGMRVDHAAAQQARHAQSLAVLCGEWPGQQWQEPLPLSDVVSAAASRIIAYKRVTVSGDPDTAVVARVAEPLIHLLAELLANAAQSSPPTTQVLVAIRPVQRGVVVEIDDGGVGLDEHRLEQAREIASGRRKVTLADLGQTPQTGLAVVGEYSRRHGFRVDLGESVYGGLRAVVLVPVELTEVVASPERTIVRDRSDMRTKAVAGDRAKAAAGIDVLTTEPSAPLPQRRSPRRQAPANSASVRATRKPAPAANPAQTPEEAARWMGALLDPQVENKPADASRSQPNNVTSDKD